MTSFCVVLYYFCELVFSDLQRFFDSVVFSSMSRDRQPSCTSSALYKVNNPKISLYVYYRKLASLLYVKYCRLFVTEDKRILHKPYFIISARHKPKNMLLSGERIVQ